MRTRRTARVLLIDQANRILLLRFEVAGQGSFWATPGGAIEEGETYYQALARELKEETGIEVHKAVFSPPVWHGEHDLAFAGERMHFVESFSVARVEQALVSIAGRTPEEQEVVRDHRWWTLPELRSTTERVYPTSLPERLPALLRGEIPNEALAIEM